MEGLKMMRYAPQVHRPPVQICLNMNSKAMIAHQTPEFHANFSVKLIKKLLVIANTTGTTSSSALVYKSTRLSKHSTKRSKTFSM